jgi:hypothetical protein
MRQLEERTIGLPGVTNRQSRLASAETRALCLSSNLARGPKDAFIDGFEFCHLHSPPSSSLHLTLPSPFREATIRLGWAEPHPASDAGYFLDTLVMVYAPRDTDELGIVLNFVEHAYQYASGAT